ncbi:hypothetical protein GCM10011332_29060 [Terasakiella brassicae]|uniref:Uncharacterized protein n=1 Tax=Terasakiella brassicae TaxID=1634917 RepID=A0A917C5S6_9PROT|nr:hypothetical protein [Terasakiella brassicae]GGF73212.1 hypothetical protein GCM10011332_29060 [Terasakiella brassicae]
MSFLSFNSHNPLDDIPRVLDLMRTMSFHLDELKVLPNANQSFCIEMTCAANGRINAHTLKHRIGKLQGIEKFHFV